ncbi:MAG: hypothetical protein BGP06_17570 [Rhizobiales bacterium 65-9]|nr:DUF1178 family protein [Hyphomicrobiales bacterium]OJY34666.1 MAG: hypothetical protein BGP06_17570 [Rhizobiales bacterium 65-9]
MIRYSLICDKEHAFESWFPDSASYDMQAKRGFVTCPACGSVKVRKALMAPRVRTSEKAEATVPAPQPPQAAGPAVQVASGRDAELRAMLRTLRDHVKANAEDVGDGFAETARKMHYGEIEHRAIYGRSTIEDARALHEEGVEFHPLPVLPDDRN